MTSDQLILELAKQLDQTCDLVTALAESNGDQPFTDPLTRRTLLSMGGVVCNLYAMLIHLVGTQPMEETDATQPATHH